MATNEEYVERALAAYYREMARAQRLGVSMALPSTSMTYVDGWNDKDYVIVQNGYEFLAVYRVKPDGLLRRLRRWPKALEPGRVAR